MCVATHSISFAFSVPYGGAVSSAHQRTHLASTMTNQSNEQGDITRAMETSNVVTCWSVKKCPSHLLPSAAAIFVVWTYAASQH